MSAIEKCPKCGSEYTYEDGLMYVCPMCSHEWPIDKQAEETAENVVKDSNGNVLEDGDSIIIIKDLKVKGSSSDIKKGTKAKNIKVYPDRKKHEIDTKIDGFGAVEISAEFVKKA